MRFFHLGLVVSLVLTTKASDNPNHDDSLSENPTGQAAVHGHPKVAAGSSGYRHAPPPYPYEPSKYNSVQAPHSGMASTMSGQHHYRPEHYQPVTAPDQADAEENTGPLVMIEDMFEDNSMAGQQEPNVHIHHTGMTSTMSGQHSSPVSTETMTDDHPEHHHRPRPVMTQKPEPISKTPLMSSEAASEENTIPLVMTEDNAMIQSEELTNAPESDEAMIEEMIETMISEHDEMISIHEFKEVIHELVKDVVDKIVMKKVGIVEKLKTAKQNLIGHVGEATSREPSGLLLDEEFCRKHRGLFTCF